VVADRALLDRIVAIVGEALEAASSAWLQRPRAA